MPLLARLCAGSKSLRFRVMLWMVGAVVVTALLVLLGLREGVRRTLIHELDQILIEDLREIRLAVADARDEFQEEFSFFEELDNQVRGHEAHDWFVRLRDLEGRVIVASPDGPSRLPAGAGRDMVPFGTNGYRVVDLHLSPPWGRIATIRIGASTESIGRDMRRIDMLVVVAAAVILAFAPLCGYWLAGRALRPVVDIIDTAARLRPIRLNERLPIRRSGDELDRLAATVNDMLDRIAVSMHERRDFLANSAHELRSPLAAIRSTVEVAVQSGRVSPQDEEAFAVVIDQCASLEHLVNQLLLLAETEAERLDDLTEEVRLDRLVATAADMFSAAAEQKDVTLHTDDLGEVAVRGRRHHLRQVVNNLLDNAIKFTPPGGTVTVSLARREADHVATLTVTDDGVGIEPDDLPLVFDRFFRADRSRPRDVGGTGLGLSICRAVVTAHGGSIAVDSTPAQGTTFTVELPLAESTSLRAPLFGAAAL